MQHVNISYHGLRGADPAYMDKLKTRESVIRRALDAIGRQDAVVHWSYVDVGSGNHVFRLLAAEDPSDCIVQVSPLDLTLEHERFERALVEGKRACVRAVSESVE